MWSLAQTLVPVTAWLPPVVAAGEGFGRVAALAGQLPAQLSHCVYLELWPPEGSSRVDLILRVDDVGRTLLADLALADPALHGLPEFCRANPIWRRIGAFSREWAVRGGWLDRTVSGMWLEFDLASATTPGAVSPRLFIDLDPTFARTSPRETICDAALQIVQMLTGAPVPSALSEHVHTCCTRLPAGAVIPYIGLSQDGPMPVVRVCMTGLAHELRSYLSALSWPGDVDDLDGRILTPLGRTFGERERHVSILHLDLKPEPSPRIGLEYAFAKDCQRNGLLRETAVLDHLVSRGWCGRALRDELPGWPGRAVAQFAHEIWHSRVTRHVSHIKLAYATGERIDAKIYLAFFFALVRGNSARLLSSRASPRLAARGER